MRRRGCGDPSLAFRAPLMWGLWWPCVEGNLFALQAWPSVVATPRGAKCEPRSGEGCVAWGGAYGGTPGAGEN